QPRLSGGRASLLGEAPPRVSRPLRGPRLPVLAREDGGAARGLARLGEAHSGGLPPARIMRCLPVRLERRFVAIDLVEEEVVRVGLVRKHIEGQTARLAARG